MTFKVDPRFSKSSKQSRKRRILRRLRRVGLVGAGVAGVLALGMGGWFLIRAITGSSDDVADAPLMSEGDGEVSMVQVDGGNDDVGIVAVRTPFLDLPKDPLILRFEQTEAEEENHFSGPGTLPVDRVGPPNPDRLTLLNDELVVRETQLITAIPSSRADLAYFQAQRSQGMAEMGEQGVIPALTISDGGEGDVVSVDGDDGSWGEVIGADAEAEDTVTYVETKIENTTSVAFALRNSARLPLYNDHIVLARIARDLTEVLTGAGIDETAARQAVSSTERLLGQSKQLPAGSLVAMRIRPDVRGARLLQMSLYQDEAYIGTLAQIGAGRFDRGADPWAGEDLLAKSQQIRPTEAGEQNVRLLDAVYSAGIRNGMSTTLVGELIVMMSQSHDMDRYAAVGDKVSILYVSNPEISDAGAGQILYAGMAGPSGKFDCYVVRDEARQGFSCSGKRGTTGTLGGGLIVPVAGIKTSGFGPRMHPVIGKLMNHNGIDWAAPSGTPIHAAAAGKVSVAGDGRGYGNVVYIDHDGARQTRYAHLKAFAPGIQPGAVVKAGQLIGYVGTTGRSTGPHLHFELRVKGVPVDPLTDIGSGGSGGAIDTLVNQIIVVESGGRADAANRNSTAVGLGQFINSTWLRMMRQYRPDLVRTMGRSELLALRLNPDMSREMVRNLARENEAYLRSRGHEITAGRLYLAHFLGMTGADKALRANPNDTVLNVMGADVVESNKFLRNMKISDIWAWADRKMRGRTGAAVVATPVSPQVKAYIDLIDSIIKPQ